MIFYIADKITGQFLGTVNIANSSEYITENTLIEQPPNTTLDYMDVFGKWITPPPPAIKDQHFDYTTKQWIDPRTLDEIKAQKWAEIKTERDQVEFGGFEFEGNIYDSDQVSQGRILGAATAEIDRVWTLKNNATVLLTAAQLQQLYQALQLHIAGVHERGRIARQLIFEAETKEQVESIQL